MYLCLRLFFFFYFSINLYDIFVIVLSYKLNVIFNVESVFFLFRKIRLLYVFDNERKKNLVWYYK